MPRVVPEYKEQAKLRILKAAKQVFSEKGYHDTHMEDISDALGVSKRTLYLYFKNKEDLFRAMCAEGLDEVKRALRECFREGGPEMACGTFFDLSIEEPRTGLEFEIIAAATRSPAVMRIQKERFDSEIGIVSQFLKRDFKGGAVPKGFNAGRKARIVIALHRGLMADLLMGARPSEVKRAWVEATDLIMENR